MDLIINCTTGCLEVYNLSSVDRLGRADSAKELAELFTALNFSPRDFDIFCSSSVDDCEEYGWKPGSARKMISRALELI